MDSSFDVDLTKIGVEPTKISGAVSGFVEDHVPLALVLVGALLVWSYASTYR